MNKEWLDLFQKLTYAQVATVRKCPVVDDSRTQEQKAEKNRDEKDRTVQKSIATTLPIEEKVIPQQQTKLVIILQNISLS